jgi:hypothetical protein
MENLSAIATTSLSGYTNAVNFNLFGQQQKQEIELNLSKPTEEKIEYLNKIGHEYPFCVYHKHKRNDPL